ncbi:MAG: hypothetical protein C0478_04435 [Planctomyces sp.]|nr:hypothetical protein [Planctomyces sp.]
MRRTPVDLLIVGQGLAGSALAWQAAARGLCVHVIERPPVQGRRPSASSVGAGLITPITGARLALGWRFDEFRSATASFYERVAANTGTRCFTDRPALRWLSPAEEELWSQKCFKTPSLKPYLRAINPTGICRSSDPLQGPENIRPYEMPLAARVNLPLFLEVTRAWLEREQAFSFEEFAPQSAIWSATDAVWQVGGITARRIVLCTGYSPALLRIPFLAAKGELLEVSLPGQPSTHTWHHGAWATPQEEDLWLVGATYDPQHLDDQPTPEGRTELCTALEKLGVSRPQVISHQAAVRPAVPGQMPVIGWLKREDLVPSLPGHPPEATSAWGVINGLGSRGSLWAPLLADWLLDASTGARIPSEVDIHRFLASKPPVAKTPRGLAPQ